MTEEVLAEELPVGIVLARQDEPDDRIEHEPEGVGTAAIVMRAEQDDGEWMVELVGSRRFRIIDLITDRPFQEALVQWLDEEEGDPVEARLLADDVLDRVEELGGQVDRGSDLIEDPIQVSHAIAAALPVDLETKQRLLEAKHAVARLEGEAEILALSP